MAESRCIQGDMASSPSADSGDIAADHYTGFSAPTCAVGLRYRTDV
jgi:hypothetical protein